MLENVYFYLELGKLVKLEVKWSHLSVIILSSRYYDIYLAPPSNVRIIPVTHDASSDAKYATPLEISSGSPNLPNGYGFLFATYSFIFSSENPEVVKILVSTAAGLQMGREFIYIVI